MFVYVNCTVCNYQSNRVEVNSIDELEAFLISYLFCPECSSANLGVYTE